MKKALQVIGITLLLLGSILIVGILGGLENDRCTCSQFFTILAGSVSMIVVGFKLFNLGE
jgi:hypothetical protein